MRSSRDTAPLSQLKRKDFKLIDIYMSFDDFIDSVIELNTKVDKIKELKNAD